MSAQTALRESIGRHELAQMITERETLGRELQRILDEKTNSLGDHGAVGGGAGRDDSAGAGRRNVAAGAGRARTAGAHDSGAGGDGDFRQVRCRHRAFTRTIPARCICAP